MRNRMQARIACRESLVPELGSSNLEAIASKLWVAMMVLRAALRCVLSSSGPFQATSSWVVSIQFVVRAMRSGVGAWASSTAAMDCYLVIVDSGN